MKQQKCTLIFVLITLVKICFVVNFTYNKLKQIHMNG